MADNEHHPNDNARHPGITMHKLTVGGGFEGLVFTVGSALIFLFGLPSLWYFVAFSVALGIGVALVIHLINRGRKDRFKQLSILSPDAMPVTSAIPRADKNKNRLDTPHGILPAWFSSVIDFR
jgi:hypothetical protein